MSKVLLTWEAGAHLGHHVLVSAAAAAIRQAGHEVVVYAPGVATPGQAAARAGVRWHPCEPLAQRPVSEWPCSWQSRATTLWNLGMGRSATVHQRLAMWDALFAHERPDVVVTQAAPFAQVAARTRGLKSVEIGIGFDVPPRRRPFVPYRNIEAFDLAHALELEDRMLNLLPLACRQAAGTAGLAAAVSGDIRLVTSLRELDHYGPIESDDRRFIGPLAVREVAGTAVEWQHQGGAKILMYLRSAYMDVAALTDRAAGMATELVLVCPDLGANGTRPTFPAHVRAFSQPITLTKLLPQADLVVCHGGGLAAEALLLGARCLLLPTHFEQFLMGRRLASARLGVMANPAQPDLFADALRVAATDAKIGASLSALLASSGVYRNAEAELIAACSTL